MSQYTQQNYQLVQNALTPLKNKIYALEKAKKSLEDAWNKYSEAADRFVEADKLSSDNESFREIEVKFKVRSGRSVVINGLRKELEEAWVKVSNAIKEVEVLS